MQQYLKKDNDRTKEQAVKIDPDTYFLTFLANSILIIVTLMTILQSHWYTGEFFMIRNLKASFNNNIYVATNKQGVSSPPLSLITFD